MIISRRGFLQLAGLSALTTVAAACGTSPPSTSPAVSSSRTGGRLTLPSYAPFQGPKPDLPSTGEGIDPGYFSFPSKLVKSFRGPAGKGEDVSIMTWNLQAPMTPVDQNPAWQEINKQLGVNLKVNAVPFADYQSKLATTLAGQDLPDVIFIPGGTAIDQFPQFLKTTCADLTPYLSGDAIKDYPNLATIPTRSWRGTVFNGGIWGVAVLTAPYLWVLWVHQELLDATGDHAPKNSDDFTRILQDLTKPKAGVYGLVTETGTGFGVTTGLFPSIFGAPNNWAAPGGKFTRSYETDAYKASVGYARDLFKAGVYSPNSLTYNNVAAKADFAARKSATRWDSWGGSGVFQYWDAAAKLKPPSSIRTIRPFAHDGGKPSYFLASGIFGFSVFKRASPDRIKQLLRVMDFLAAPFGSQENLLLHYGVQGTDFNFDDKGNPAVTTKGNADVNNTIWTNITAPARVLFYPPRPKEYATVAQADEQAMWPLGVDDPSVGLYSPTDGSKGPALNKAFADGVSDIVAGRRPLSDYDQLVRDWRSGGGDQIRSEYQQALQGASA